MSKYSYSVIKKKHKCLYCLKQFYLWEAPFRSHNPKGKTIPDYEYAHYWGGTPPEVSPLTFNEVADKGIGTQKELHRIKDRICPHCRSELPADFFEQRSLSIYVTGIRSSGKTVYLQALFRQIIERFSSIGVFELYSENAKLSSKSFTQGDLPNPTSATVKQKPYILKARDRRSSRAVYLSIFDIAGETLNDLQDIQERSPSLAYADGYIIMVDPTQDEMYQKIIPSSNNVSLEDTLTILNNFCQYYRSQNDDMIDLHIKVPTVYLLTKLDALKGNVFKEVIDVDAVDDLISKTPRYDRRRVSAPKLIKALNYHANTVQEMIEDNRSHFNDLKMLYDNFTANFSNIKTFACSAYPDGVGQVNSKPIKVADPVLWIMSRYHFLPNQASRVWTLNITTFVFFFMITSVILWINKSSICGYIGEELPIVCGDIIEIETEKEDSSSILDDSSTYIPTAEQKTLWKKWEDIGFIWKKVPGGNFSLSEGNVYHIPDFYMTKTEVTNKQFHTCVQQGLCTEPSFNHLGCTYLYGGIRSAAQKPINCLSFNDAQRFADYANTALPSDVQWLYAATNAGKHLNFPQAVIPLSSLKQTFRLCDQEDCSEQGTINVASLESQGNEFGLYDLVGNLSEFVRAEGIVTSDGYVFGGSYNDHIETISVSRHYQVTSQDHSLYAGVRLIIPAEYLKGYQGPLLEE